MSNMTKKRSFTPEFKAEVCQLVLSEKKTVTEVADEHDLHSSQVYSWLKKAREDGVAAPTAKSSKSCDGCGKKCALSGRNAIFLADAARYFAKAKK